MREKRNRERPSWYNDPELDRKIEKRVMMNNLFAIVVIIIIMVALLYK